jgi:predicted aspartyl protease
MKGWILFLLLFISIHLNAQNPLGFYLSDNKDFVELSFKEESNLIVIPILVNGNGPYNFILDTGSESGLIFDRWVIAENNLVNARKIPIYASNGNKVTDLLVANDLKIQMTGVEASQQTMLVLKENNLDIKGMLGINAHGVLGSELFNRFVVEIDYQNEKIRLYKHDHFKAPKGYKRMDIEVKSFRPYITVDIKQKGRKRQKFNLLIDSGASSALFLDEQRHEQIDLPKKTLDHTIGSGITGLLSGKIGRVKKVWLGKHFKFKNVITSYPQQWKIQTEVSDRDGTIIRHGTLGSDMLSRFNVIYDYLNGAVYFKKTKEYKEEFKFNRAGFTFTALGKELNQYFIADIIPNSPAEKIGLQPNDEIIAIGNKPVFFYTFSEINGFLRGDTGTSFDIIIRRNGELFKKTLRLRKLI